MRRPLSTAAVVLVATAGVLATGGPAAAEGGLVPGLTQDVRVDLDRDGWRETPEVLAVAVAAVGSAENGCLAPERDMGDGCADEGADPDADPGELVDQLSATVAPGSVDGSGKCAPLGPSVDLPLVAPSPDGATGKPVLRYLPLTLDTGASWSAVTCLTLALTFEDRPDNNLAQSDTLELELEVSAESFAPGGGTGPGDGGATGGTGGGAPGGGGGTAGPGVGGPPAGVGPTAGVGAGNGRGVAPGVPVRGGAAAQGVTPGGTVVGRSAASVTVDDDGVRSGTRPGSGTTTETRAQAEAAPDTPAQTQTLTRAAGQSLGAAVMWAGGLFLAVLALGWFLFLVVRRRRRAESAA
ncbi:hypothetical protein [Trujillonella humicola]|uniref:hypothetical protein n=1 Tax=Trujillonella humicola TaxID=3383699 RepID=UPI0039057DC0